LLTQSSSSVRSICFPALVNYNMKPTQLLTLVIPAILLISCSTPRYIYAPAPPIAAYFNKKGDAKLSGYFSGGPHDGAGHNRGLDVQAAYALTNHVALTSTYFLRREHDIRGADVKYKRNIIDFGAGAFTVLDKHNTVYGAFYSGIGFGKFNIEDYDPRRQTLPHQRMHNSSVRKIYMQPSLNFRSGKNFRMMLALRASFVHYGDINTSYTESEIYSFGFDHINNRSKQFLETSVALQWSIPKTPWLAIDLNGTICSQEVAPGTQLESRGILGSIGLSFDFSKMKRKK
jgi:hypothetical protein